LDLVLEYSLTSVSINPGQGNRRQTMFLVTYRKTEHPLDPAIIHTTIVKGINLHNGNSMQGFREAIVRESGLVSINSVQILFIWPLEE